MDRDHMLPSLELALAVDLEAAQNQIQGETQHHQRQRQQQHPHSASQFPPPPTYAQSFHDFPALSASAATMSAATTSSTMTTAPTAPQLPPLQPQSALQSAPDVAYEQQRLPSLAALAGGIHAPAPHAQPHSHPLPGLLPPPQLPPISSLRRPSPPPIHKREHSPALTTDAPGGQSHHRPSINPPTAFCSPPPANFGHGSERSAPISDRAAEMDIDKIIDGYVPPIASPARVHETRANSVSLDDPEVRIAAQALSDLRTDFSPCKRHGSMSTVSTSHESMASAPPTTPSQPEPLLSLLTTSHPFLGRTISNATAAYMTSKNNYALFRSSAEYVEGYLTPLANTVGSVSRFTGVEGGVRWYLNSRRPPSSDGCNGSGPNKRRRIDYDGPEDETRGRTGEIDPSPHKNRRLSSASIMDTLPAYEEVSPSPAYTETATEIISPDRRVAPSLDWQSRIIMSTSGLSVAMSEESLRRLRYCLNLIRRVNSHINGTVTTLKRTLEQYEQAEPDPDPDPDPDPESKSAPSPTTCVNELPMAIDEESQGPRNGDSRTVLAARLDHLRDEVMSTLKKTIDTVSRYAGGALPDNARVLVRRHLTSLPQRFRVASMLDGNLGARRTSGEADCADGEANTAAKQVRERAHMAIVAANAGLDVVDQVGRILDGTITSAEEWCERLGKSVSNSQATTNGGGEGERRPHTYVPEKDVSGDMKMI